MNCWSKQTGNTFVFYAMIYVRDTHSFQAENEYQMIYSLMSLCPSIALHHYDRIYDAL